MLRFSLSVLAIILAVTFSSKVSAQASEETGDFNLPMVRGYAVNWCKHQGRDCGKPAADLFCNEMGYQRATSFTHDQRSGARGVDSLIFGDGMLCQGTQCQSFGAITCAREVANPIPQPLPAPSADGVLVAPTPAPTPPDGQTAPLTSPRPLARLNVAETDPGGADLFVDPDDDTPWGGAQPLAIGAQLAICLTTSCERTDDVTSTVVIGEARLTVFEVDLSAVEFAKLGIWQVSDRPFPRFNASDLDRDFPGLVASGFANGGVSTLVLDLDAALEASPFDYLSALYVRVIPLRDITGPAFEAAPTNTIRVVLQRPTLDTSTLTWLYDGAHLAWCRDSDCEFADVGTAFVPPGETSLRLISDMSQLTLASRVVWQVSAAPFLPVGGQPSDFDFPQLLASGEIVGGRWNFDVDIAAAIANGPFDYLKRVYVRTIPVHDAGMRPAMTALGKASNTIPVIFNQDTPTPEDFSFVEEDPNYVYGNRDPVGLFEIELLSFSPPELADPEFWGCVVVLDHTFGDNDHQMVVDTITQLYPVGQRFCPERYRGDSGKVETFAEFIDWATGSFDWVADKYNGLVSLAARIALQVTGLSLACEAVGDVAGDAKAGVAYCEGMATAAIQAGATSLGVPPSLPNFNQLIDEGVDYAVTLAADEITQRTGIPCVGPCEDALRVGLENFADEIKRTSDEPGCVDPQQAHMHGREPLCMPPQVLVRPAPNAVTRLPFVQLRVTRTSVRVPENRVDPMERCTIAVSSTFSKDLVNHIAIGTQPGQFRTIPDQAVVGQLYKTQTGDLLTDIAAGTSIEMNLTQSPKWFEFPWTFKAWNTNPLQGPYRGIYRGDWQTMFYGSEMNVAVNAYSPGGVPCMAEGTRGGLTTLQMPDWRQ